jgi:hypothetical protein
LVERDERLEKLVMLARGVVDGLTGRLGRRVRAGDGDRPIGSLAAT